MLRKISFALTRPGSVDSLQPLCTVSLNNPEARISLTAMEREGPWLLQQMNFG